MKQNINLKEFNTFGIEVFAKEFLALSSKEESIEFFKNNPLENENFLILGGGSNLLLTEDFDGLVIHNNLKGIEICEEDDNSVTLKVGAGENWHNFVLHSIELGYSGIENLSLIPGNVGASPMQNIGAYGVELKDVFHSCNAVNLNTKSIKTFKKEECKFGYRESVFKQKLKGQFIITSVLLKLTKKNHLLHIDYGAIKTELESLNIINPSIKDISEAVIKIRKSKLPDPKEIGNSGSFFKNPVLNKIQFTELQKTFPKVPHYVVSDSQIKVPAGWLIETAGFKGKRFNNYGVHNKQALVLVNYGNADGKDIYKLAQLIQITVKRIFNIKIETEVNII